MKAPVILLVILLVLFLIGQIRIGVRVNYAQDGVAVWAKAAALQFKVFPLPKREKKVPKQKKTKKDKAPEKEKPPRPLPEKIGGALDYAQALLPVLLDAVSHFYRKLQVDTLDMELTAGSSDPADAARLYGQASALLGAIWYPLTQTLHVKDGNARVKLDFDAPTMTLYADAALSLKIGQLLWIGIYFGLRALKRFLAVRKQQKLKQRKAV